LTSYLPLVNLTGFNTTQFIQNITANASYVPTTAMAISGGGYVATLTGLGAYQAMDARYPPAISSKTGGLAQCLTYLTGLSGGGVAVGTLAANNYPTIQDLYPQWNPTVNPFTGPNASNFEQYYAQLFETIGEKAQQGFNVSLSDLLGRLFSVEFILGTNGGVNKTFSDIQVLFVRGWANDRGIPISLTVWRQCQFCLVEDLKINGTQEFDGIFIPAANATFVFSWYYKY
jgi:lysophospholipase